MVNKKALSAAVSDLRKEMSEAPEAGSPEKAEDNMSNAQEQAVDSAKETGDDHDLQMKDIEHLLEQHGVDFEELKGVWDQFLNELRDLPAKKPLVTVFGAFLLGFLAGRTSRK